MLSKNPIDGHDCQLYAEKHESTFVSSIVILTHPIPQQKTMEAKWNRHKAAGAVLAYRYPKLAFAI